MHHIIIKNHYAIYHIIINITLHVSHTSYYHEHFTFYVKKSEIFFLH